MSGFDETQSLVGITELYMGFDPGHTTGYVCAGYHPGDNKLVLLDWRPLALGARYPTIDITCPPLVCFGDLYEEILAKFALVGAIAHDPPRKIFVAIEDFKGGAGGDIQNTVNKIIGMVLAVGLDNASVNGEWFTVPKIYANISRRPYLGKAKSLTDGRTNPRFLQMSKHSKDALAHVMHRLEQEHPGAYKTLKIE